MQEIIQYAFFWRTEENVGAINLALADGSGGQVIVDSPAEASLLLDVLRNERPVFYDRANALIMTGLEPVGEGE
ncbi:hypothetical protein [Candidatus Entotheonella palauensis]|uniref:Uncharacterized protein n=1 Tax=Candidatus Entotheonella gemina TaxID=1429439 RepID=W4MDN9_9BACT|nr:hypothetical protein [Candidatus Entotheonella palauensis]ETX07757.1 MAG: hypothetical protein ETSY2_09325 [Candidatus Entotheonella gemina]